jgi:hypothetical protein
MKWFRKFFAAKKAKQWAATPAEEFGVGNFRYVFGTYAKKGDAVTCERGHHICTFQRDVAVSDPFDSTVLGDWRQPEPKKGTVYQPCMICGARWYKGVYLHFPGGWRIGGNYARLPGD